MQQINGAFVETILAFVEKYGPPVALAVLGLAGLGIVMRILYRLATRGGPKKS